MASNNMFDILNVDEDTRPNKKEAHGKGAKAASARTGGRAPKREFERHSGTGRGKEQRKSGAGKFWGGKAENEDDAARIGQQQGDYDRYNRNNDEDSDDDQKTLGFDDFLKSQQQGQVADDKKVKARASNKDSKFKGSVLAKKAEEPLFADCIDRKQKAKKGPKNRKNVVSLDQFVALNPGSAPARSNNNDRRGPRDGERKGNNNRGNKGGDNRGRGRGRGRGGRGGRGGQRRNDNNNRGGSRPNITNNKDFPTLGGN